MSNPSSQSEQMSLPVIVAIIFIILKLTGNLNWSWWWILAPIWIPLSIFICIILLGVFSYCLLNKGKNKYENT